MQVPSVCDQSEFTFIRPYRKLIGGSYKSEGWTSILKGIWVGHLLKVCFCHWQLQIRVRFAIKSDPIHPNAGFDPNGSAGGFGQQQQPADAGAGEQMAYNQQHGGHQGQEVGTKTEPLLNY
jgi:hypothetical protein